MNRRSLFLFLRCTLLAACPACKKAFLDALPSTALIVPSTLTNYQNILDNTSVMSYTPLLGELSADNFYLVDSFWQTLDTREHNAYNWAADIYQGQGLVDDWDVPYSQVFYANIVLEGLPTIAQTTENRQQWQSEQGSALFFRAYAFYNLAQLFAPPYDSATAATDLGIPLRLHSDINAPSIRSSVAATYAQILADLQQARPLLSPELPYAYRNRPSQPAVYALLARVCLSMRNYPLAGRYADSALQLYDSLTNYNTVPVKGLLPFTRLNPEAIYQSNFLSYTQCLTPEQQDCIVDSTLYSSYGPGDLRPTVFDQLNSTGQPNLRGSYAGLIFPFSGLATDELYLIRAEAGARAGNTTAALMDLNTLLQKRYTTGTFTPLTASSPAAALTLILAERRKELPFRGLRWSDLRRLNEEGYNITPTRILYGTPYQLTPNSNRYTLPIPPDVLDKNPTMQQNPR